MEGDRCGGCFALEARKFGVEGAAIAEEQAFHFFVAVVVGTGDGCATGIDAGIGIGACFEQDFCDFILGIAGCMGKGLTPAIGFGFVVVKLVAVVGIEAEIEQQFDHVEAVVLDRDLEEAVSVAVVGLEAFGVGLGIGADKVLVVEGNCAFERQFTTGLEEEAYGDEAAFVDGSVAPPDVVYCTVERGSAFGGEVRDIGAPVEEFLDEHVAAVGGGGVNGASAVSVTGVEQVGVVVEKGECFFVAATVNGSEKGVVFGADGDIFACRKDTFFVFFADDL